MYLESLKPRKARIIVRYWTMKSKESGRKEVFGWKKERYYVILHVMMVLSIVFVRKMWWISTESKLPTRSSFRSEFASFRGTVVIKSEGEEEAEWMIISLEPMDLLPCSFRKWLMLWTFRNRCLRHKNTFISLKNVKKVHLFVHIHLVVASMYLFDDDSDSGRKKKGMKRKGSKNGTSTKMHCVRAPERPWYVGHEKDNLRYTWASKAYDWNELVMRIVTNWRSELVSKRSSFSNYWN